MERVGPLPRKCRPKKVFRQKWKRNDFGLHARYFIRYTLWLWVFLYIFGDIMLVGWTGRNLNQEVIWKKSRIPGIPQDFRRCVSNKTKRLEASKAKYREGLRNSGCLGSGRRVIQSAKYDPGNKNGHSALSLLYPKESLSLFWWLSSISGTWRKILSHQFFHRTQMTMALTRRKCWFLLLYFMLKIRSHIQYIS